MLRIQPIKAIDHGKEPYEDFINSLRDIGLPLDNLGQSYLGVHDYNKHDTTETSTGTFSWVEQRVLMKEKTNINYIEWKSSTEGEHSLQITDASGNVIAESNASGTSWITFNFLTPIPVSVDEEYRIRVTLPTPSQVYRRGNFLYEGLSWKVLANVVDSSDKTFEESQAIAINTDVDSNRSVDIYGTKIGDFTHKPVIAIQGSIHGNEWESAYWVREFLRMLIQGHDGYNHNIGPNRELFQRLRATFDFVSIPVANPGGYINNSRYARDGIDLNRNYDINWHGFTGDSYQRKGDAPFSEPETQASRDYLGGTRPFLFIDCHTWATHQIHGGYWGDPSDSRYTAFCRDLEKSIQLLFNTPLELNPVYAKLPHAPRWFASRRSKEAIHPLAFTVESNRRDSYEDRFFYGINTMFLVCVHILLWSEKRKLPVTK